MSKRQITRLLVSLSFVLVSAGVPHAQHLPDSSRPQTPANQTGEAKKKLENQALALLDQILVGAQDLKLAENRAHVQMVAGDMLWNRNEGRARELLTEAASTIAQMDRSDPRGEHNRNVAELRRDLVLMAARHDVDLAFQILSSTQQLVPGENQSDESNDLEANLIQTLLSIAAANDPKAAFRRAVDSLDKGQYPRAIATVLRHLHSTEKEAFEKLSSKLIGKLSTENLLASNAAGDLAIDLLRLGPINEQDVKNDSCLKESSYRELLNAALIAALTPPSNVTHSTTDAVTFMGIDVMPANRDAVMIIGGDGRRGVSVSQSENQPNEAQTRKDNIDSLLSGMQRLLPQIDRYFPDRADLVRQRLKEMGISNNQVIAVDTATSENLTTAAGLAPTEMQSDIYQRAAQKAIEEGNLDRALQIASDHLNQLEREQTVLAVELRKAGKDSSTKLDKIRQTLAALPSDSARLRALLSFANAAEQENPGLALKLLESARLLVCKRAIHYEDFENQLRVSEAMAALDVKRSFEVFEWGIPQLNDILVASAVVNGFEAEVFREGELPLKGGSKLGNMVGRYGRELGALARIDFDRALTAADKFQLPETRSLVKLQIVEVILETKTSQLSQ